MGEWGETPTRRDSRSFFRGQARAGEGVRRETRNEKREERERKREIGERKDAKKTGGRTDQKGMRRGGVVTAEMGKGRHRLFVNRGRRDVKRPTRNSTCLLFPQAFPLIIINNP